MAYSHEEQTRIDLAATFRIIAHLGMHEAVANHFSAALSADGKTFLLNPKWKHFSPRASFSSLHPAGSSRISSNTTIPLGRRMGIDLLAKIFAMLQTHDAVSELTQRRIVGHHHNGSPLAV